MDKIEELQRLVTEALVRAEEKTREAARAWDRVAHAEMELMNALESGSLEKELVARAIMEARQAANRIWLTLGAVREDPPSETN